MRPAESVRFGIFSLSQKRRFLERFFEPDVCAALPPLKRLAANISCQRAGHEEAKKESPAFRRGGNV